ncbi:MAG: iron ABC transporter permease [Chloroflexi bacterium]|nr:iron ABC transporter permease [Ardenticatenaceae bacterium]MBL1128657.1 iron ABC transporter permease [Chloroflexota bacterium]NOG34735.1 iron ABC transporter permease [Chloroflexota bacterium]GIK55054.1 MAG: iron ABC transporter permease [Chloroflexota bacterium]
MQTNEFPKPNWIALRPRFLPFSARVDRRVPAVFLVLCAVLLLVLVLSVSYGAYKIALLDVLRAAVGLETSDPNHALVVRSFRLPRILLALLIGMALAASGAIIQGLTRNDLADPGLLGINSGAGVAVVGYITFAAMPNDALLPWLALAGALGASAVIYLLAWKGGVSSLRLILVGVGLASLGGALISYFITRLTLENAQRAYAWLTGSVYASTWPEVRLMALWLLVLLPLAFLFARQLNLFNLGDDIATSLGTRVEQHRLTLIALSAALAAITVTVAGTIAFVGFVAPHIARRLVGPTHEGLLISTVFVGGLLLVVADLVARWVIAPGELPLGVTTAVIGAPYFAYLLYKRGR